jgi:hypothetical protein
LTFIAGCYRLSCLLLRVSRLYGDEKGGAG